MKRFDPKAVTRFGPMDEAITGKYVEFKDDQEIAKAVLPFVEHVGDHFLLSSFKDAKALADRLNKIIEGRP